MGWPPAAEPDQPVPDCSLQKDPWRDVHAGPQQPLAVLPGVDDDFRGNSLNDLDEIASCVLGRKQAEQRARGSGNAVDVPVVGLSGRINVDLRTQSRMDTPQLSLLEV